MKPKHVSLTGKERLAVQTMLSMEIKYCKEAEEWGMKPIFDKEMLKALYKKLAGFEWKENQEED